MEQDFLIQFKPPFRTQDGRSELWDGVRKKWIAATPEEHVRQRMIAWLVCYAMIPISRISVERTVPGISGRWDIAVFNNFGKPILLAECKANSEQAESESIFQVAHYAQAIPSVSWLWISNGAWLHWLHRESNQVPWQYTSERSFLQYSKGSR
ncbi:MAG: type I restriction enzyme HsdR N-terminal domain-containing protein [Bacteroidia bacterium]|nr:type I restriction enzyme HsdR N-terminal domain-containing protein [Bacteroidia bacterium]